jgi:hypothetical protein
MVHPGKFYHVVRPGVYLIVGLARAAVRTKLFELISPNVVRIWKAWKEKSTEGARGVMYILWSIGTEQRDLCRKYANLQQHVRYLARITLFR